MVKTVYEQLLKFGAVKRGLLGVDICNNGTPDDAQAFGAADIHGAVVSQVFEGSAAETAGIKTGDIVTAVNGAAVKSAADLRNTIGLLRAGEHVEVSLLRDGKPRKVTALITESTDSQAVDNTQIFRGSPERNLRTTTAECWSSPLKTRASQRRPGCAPTI